jgi:hypothetical protein
VSEAVLWAFGMGAYHFTNRKSILFSGFRQVSFGLVAAAITYGIGLDRRSLWQDNILKFKSIINNQN